MGVPIIGLGLIVAVLAADDSEQAAKWTKHSELGLRFECPSDWVVEAEESKGSAKGIKKGSKKSANRKTIKISAPAAGSCSILISRVPRGPTHVSELEKTIVESHRTSVKLFNETELDGHDKPLERKIMGQVRNGRQFEHVVEPDATRRSFLLVEVYVFDFPPRNERFTIRIYHGASTRMYSHRGDATAILNSLRH